MNFLRLLGVTAPLPLFAFVLSPEEVSYRAARAAEAARWGQIFGPCVCLFCVLFLLLIAYLLWELRD